MPPNKRREMDLMKLMMKDFKVEMEDDGLHKFFVHFHGPKEIRVLNHDEVKRLKSLGYLGRFGIGGSFGNKCIYEGGLWKVSVKLPDGYPFVSPSIVFVNKMYHPNIDEVSGSICLDVIKKKWSPMFDLVNVFENFLPQLLLDPNASDPLNREAAVLMTRNRPAYEQKVKEYCKRYAKPEETAASEDETSEVELSEDEYDSIDEQLGRRSD